MNKLSCPNAVVLTATRKMTILNGRFSKEQGCMFYIWISIACNVKLMKFVSLESNQILQWLELVNPKLDLFILKSEGDIEGYDVIRMDCSRKGLGVACYI